MTSAFLSLIGALVVALGVFVLRANPLSTTHLYFAAFTMSLSIWLFGIAAWCYETFAELGLRVAFAGASLIAPTFLGLTRTFPSHLHEGAWRWLAGPLFVGGMFSILSLTTPLVAYDAAVSASGLHRRAGPLYPAFAVFFITTFAAATTIFFQRWWNARGHARAQLQYLGVAILVPGAAAITTNLILPVITGRSTYSWLGPFFTGLLVALVAHAVIRHRLMDLRLVIHKSLTLVIAVVLSILPVAAIVLVMFWPPLSYHLDPHELIPMVAAVFAVTILVTPIRREAERFLDKYLYRAQADFKRTVREASELLTRVLDLRTVVRFVSDTIARSTEAEGIAVYLIGDSGWEVALSERRHEGAKFQALTTAPPSIVDWLKNNRRYLIQDEPVARRDFKADTSLQDALSRLDWGLVLPLLSEATLIGFIAVGPKRSGDPFYPHDLDLLMTLANQAGIAVKNAQLYTEVVLANEYVENIVATIESGVVAVNPAGRVTMFNRAAERLTALRAEAIRSESVSGLPEVLGTLLRTTLEDGQARTAPEIALHAGSTTRPVICTTSPLRDPGGAILGAVAVFSDLTPLKELEAERQRVERLAYFEVLASSIAHEIKNPVVAIKTFTQLIPRRLHDHAFLENFSRVVSREIERMERLVERFRRLSRPASPTQHRLDVRQPLSEAVEFLKPAFEEKGLTLRVTPTPVACFVLGDEGELESLFINLLMNAHEATPRGGSVELELTASERAVVVEVADSGPGIPPERLRQLFDPFFTTKARGSGLGLTISAGIAARHRAKLRASNRPAGGALFTVEFPAATTVEATTTRVNTGG